MEEGESRISHSLQYIFAFFWRHNFVVCCH